MTVPNQHVYERLKGIQHMLVGAHKAGGPLSSASKGTEREYFVNAFLSQVFPPPFRFGHGDVTDSEGRKSGQLDVVVEFPFLPSLPIIGSASSRLYLAEGVGAVVEVKSDVAGLWGEVISTANRLSTLRRKFGATLSIGQPPSERIPLYAVGYAGWKEINTLKTKLDEVNANEILVEGIFVINSALYYGRTVHASDAWSLWGLIASIHEAISSVMSTSAHPITYAL